MNHFVTHTDKVTKYYEVTGYAVIDKKSIYLNTIMVLFKIRKLFVTHQRYIYFFSSMRLLQINDIEFLSLINQNFPFSLITHVILLLVI